MTLRGGTMKKTTLVCAIATVFTVASFAAQDKAADAKHSKEVKQETKSMTAKGTAKAATDTVVGKVESYEPGKSITVAAPGKIASTKSFDLDAKDTTVNVAPNVKVGERVSVVEKTDNNGHKTVTVKPAAHKAVATAKKTEHNQK